MSHDHVPDIRLETSSDSINNDNNHHKHAESDSDSDTESAIDPREYDGVWEKIRHWRGPIPVLRKTKTPLSIIIAYTILTLSIVVELYYATIGIMLTVDETDKTWTVFTATSWPRVAFFVFVSVLLDPFRFWIQWIKVDPVLVTGLAAVAAYGFYVDSDPEDSEGIRRAAIASYSVLTMALAGHIRVMSKYFPWNKWSIWVYKLVRGYHVLFYVITELTTEFLESEEEEVEPEEVRHSKMQIVWIIVSLEFLHELFDVVHEKETEMHEEEREKRNKRERKKLSRRHH